MSTPTLSFENAPSRVVESTERQHVQKKTTAYVLVPPFPPGKRREDYRPIIGISKLEEKKTERRKWIQVLQNKRAMRMTRIRRGEVDVGETEAEGETEEEVDDEERDEIEEFRNETEEDDDEIEELPDGAE
ncbi:hypothetical protein NLJ89_g6641 [Agrocybe chaxingu]|uniref:Uncharacterized protein n=1 Tax=Agrocybe chaxingu TaxID=84603 RepID=A0A9W8K563_9AGAR|nr:hypothetical protein NLJ89_g6641 [Agrocybe chaxingu]